MTATTSPSLRELSEAGQRIVPAEPTEAMWGGLARQIVMWHRAGRPTGANLYRDLKNVGWPIPAWLYAEIEDADYVPPKGAVAVAIYRAMLDACPDAPTVAEREARARAEGPGWQTMETAPREARFWGKVGEDAIAMEWNDGFQAFVSSWRRMMMGPGLTIDGKQFKDHSPVIHHPEGWMLIPEARHDG